LLLLAKITGYVHPVTLHCWGASENIYKHYYDWGVALTKDDQFFFKDFLLNFVYNFGHIFDAIREIVQFVMADPRGTVNNVHDAGYNMGLVQYYLYTPDIAIYRTESIHHTKTDYEDLTDEEMYEMNN
jgi:hypothetical protein